MWTSARFGRGDSNEIGWSNLMKPEFLCQWLFYSTSVDDIYENDWQRFYWQTFIVCASISLLVIHVKIYKRANLNEKHKWCSNCWIEYSEVQHSQVMPSVEIYSVSTGKLCCFFCLQISVEMYVYSEKRSRCWIPVTVKSFSPVKTRFL